MSKKKKITSSKTKVPAAAEIVQALPSIASVVEDVVEKKQKKNTEQVTRDNLETFNRWLDALLNGVLGIANPDIEKRFNEANKGKTEQFKNDVKSQAIKYTEQLDSLRQRLSLIQPSKKAIDNYAAQLNVFNGKNPDGSDAKTASGIPCKSYDELYNDLNKLLSDPKAKEKFYLPKVEGKYKGQTIDGIKRTLKSLKDDQGEINKRYENAIDTINEAARKKQKRADEKLQAQKDFDAQQATIQKNYDEAVEARYKEKIDPKNEKAPRVGKVTDADSALKKVRENIQDDIDNINYLLEGTFGYWGDADIAKQLAKLKRSHDIPAGAIEKLKELQKNVARIGKDLINLKTRLLPLLNDDIKDADGNAIDSFALFELYQKVKAGQNPLGKDKKQCKSINTIIKNALSVLGNNIDKQDTISPDEEQYLKLINNYFKHSGITKEINSEKPDADPEKIELYRYHTRKSNIKSLEWLQKHAERTDTAFGTKKTKHDEAEARKNARKQEEEDIIYIYIPQRQGEIDALNAEQEGYKKIADDKSNYSAQKTHNQIFTTIRDIDYLLNGIFGIGDDDYMPGKFGRGKGLAKKYANELAEIKQRVKPLAAELKKMKGRLQSLQSFSGSDSEFLIKFFYAVSGKDEHGKVISGYKSLAETVAECQKLIDEDSEAKRTYFGSSDIVDKNNKILYKGHGKKSDQAAINRLTNLDEAFFDPLIQKRLQWEFSAPERERIAKIHQEIQERIEKRKQAQIKGNINFRKSTTPPPPSVKGVVIGQAPGRLSRKFTHERIENFSQSEFHNYLHNIHVTGVNGSIKGHTITLAYTVDKNGKRLKDVPVESVENIAKMFEEQNYDGKITYKIKNGTVIINFDTEDIEHFGTGKFLATEIAAVRTVIDYTAKNAESQKLNLISRIDKNSETYKHLEKVINDLISCGDDLDTDGKLKFDNMWRKLSPVDQRNILRFAGTYHLTADMTPEEKKKFYNKKADNGMGFHAASNGWVETYTLPNGGRFDITHARLSLKNMERLSHHDLPTANENYKTLYNTFDPTGTAYWLSHNETHDISAGVESSNIDSAGKSFADLIKGRNIDSFVLGKLILDYGKFHNIKNLDKKDKEELRVFISRALTGMTSYFLGEEAGKMDSADRHAAVGDAGELAEMLKALNEDTDTVNKFMAIANAMKDADQSGDKSAKIAGTSDKIQLLNVAIGDVIRAKKGRTRQSHLDVAYSHEGKKKDDPIKVPTNIVGENGKPYDITDSRYLDYEDWVVRKGGIYQIEDVVFLDGKYILTLHEETRNQHVHLAFDSLQMLNSAVNDFAGEVLKSDNADRDKIIKNWQVKDLVNQIVNTEFSYADAVVLFDKAKIEAAYKDEVSKGIKDPKNKRDFDRLYNDKWTAARVVLADHPNDPNLKILRYVYEKISGGPGTEQQKDQYFRQALIEIYNPTMTLSRFMEKEMPILNEGNGNIKGSDVIKKARLFLSTWKSYLKKDTYNVLDRMFKDMQNGEMEKTVSYNLREAIKNNLDAKKLLKAGYIEAIDDETVDDTFALIEKNITALGYDAANFDSWQAVGDEIYDNAQKHALQVYTTEQMLVELKKNENLKNFLEGRRGNEGRRNKEGDLVAGTKHVTGNTAEFYLTLLSKVVEDSGMGMIFNYVPETNDFQLAFYSKKEQRMVSHIENGETKFDLSKMLVIDLPTINEYNEGYYNSQRVANPIIFNYDKSGISVSDLMTESIKSLVEHLLEEDEEKPGTYRFRYSSASIGVNSSSRAGIQKYARDAAYAPMQRVPVTSPVGVAKQVYDDMFGDKTIEQTIFKTRRYDFSRVFESLVDIYAKDYDGKPLKDAYAKEDAAMDLKAIFVLAHEGQEALAKSYADSVGGWLSENYQKIIDAYSMKKLDDGTGEKKSMLDVHINFSATREELANRGIYEGMGIEEYQPLNDWISPAFRTWNQMTANYLKRVKEVLEDEEKKKIGEMGATRIGTNELFNDPRMSAALKDRNHSMFFYNVIRKGQEKIQFDENGNIKFENGKLAFNGKTASEDETWYQAWKFMDWLSNQENFKDVMEDWRTFSASRIGPSSLAGNGESSNLTYDLIDALESFQAKSLRLSLEDLRKSGVADNVLHDLQNADIGAVFNNISTPTKFTLDGVEFDPNDPNRTLHSIRKGINGYIAIYTDRKKLADGIKTVMENAAKGTSSELGIATASTSNRLLSALSRGIIKYEEVIDAINDPTNKLDGLMKKLERIPLSGAYVGALKADERYTPVSAAGQIKGFFTYLLNFKNVDIRGVLSELPESIKGAFRFEQDGTIRYDANQIKDYADIKWLNSDAEGDTFDKWKYRLEKYGVTKEMADFSQFLSAGTINPFYEYEYFDVNTATMDELIDYMDKGFKVGPKDKRAFFAASMAAGNTYEETEELLGRLLHFNTKSVGIAESYVEAIKSGINSPLRFKEKLSDEDEALIVTRGDENVGFGEISIADLYTIENADHTADSEVSKKFLKAIRAKLVEYRKSRPNATFSQMFFDLTTGQGTTEQGVKIEGKQQYMRMALPIPMSLFGDLDNDDDQYIDSLSGDDLAPIEIIRNFINSMNRSDLTEEQISNRILEFNRELINTMSRGGTLYGFANENKQGYSSFKKNTRAINEAVIRADKSGFFSNAAFLNNESIVEMLSAEISEEKFNGKKGEQYRNNFKANFQNLREIYADILTKVYGNDQQAIDNALKTYKSYDLDTTDITQLKMCQDALVGDIVASITITKFETKNGQVYITMKDGRELSLSEYKTKIPSLHLIARRYPTIALMALRAARLYAVDDATLKKGQAWLGIGAQLFVNGDYDGDAEQFWAAVAGLKVDPDEDVAVVYKDVNEKLNRIVNYMDLQTYLTEQQEIVKAVQEERVKKGKKISTDNLTDEEKQKILEEAAKERAALAIISKSKKTGVGLFSNYSTGARFLMSDLYKGQDMITQVLVNTFFQVFEQEGVIAKRAKAHLAKGESIDKGLIELISNNKKVLNQFRKLAEVTTEDKLSEGLDEIFRLMSYPGYAVDDAITGFVGQRGFTQMAISVLVNEPEFMKLHKNFADFTPEKQVEAWRGWIFQDTDHEQHQKAFFKYLKEQGYDIPDADKDKFLHQALAVDDGDIFGNEKELGLDLKYVKKALMKVFRDYQASDLYEKNGKQNFWGIIPGTTYQPGHASAQINEANREALIRRILRDNIGGGGGLNPAAYNMLGSGYSDRYPQELNWDDWESAATKLLEATHEYAIDGKTIDDNKNLHGSEVAAWLFGKKTGSKYKDINSVLESHKDKLLKKYINEDLAGNDLGVYDATNYRRGVSSIFTTDYGNLQHEYENMLSGLEEALEPAQYAEAENAFINKFVNSGLFDKDKLTKDLEEMKQMSVKMNELSKRYGKTMFSEKSLSLRGTTIDKTAGQFLSTTADRLLFNKENGIWTILDWKNKRGGPNQDVVLQNVLTSRIWAKYFQDASKEAGITYDKDSNEYNIVDESKLNDYLQNVMGISIKDKNGNNTSQYESVLDTLKRMAKGEKIQDLIRGLVINEDGSKTPTADLTDLLWEGGLGEAKLAQALFNKMHSTNAHYDNSQQALSMARNALTRMSGGNKRREEITNDVIDIVLGGESIDNNPTDIQKLLMSDTDADLNLLKANASAANATHSLDAVKEIVDYVDNTQGANQVYASTEEQNVKAIVASYEAEADILRDILKLKKEVAKYAGTDYEAEAIDKLNEALEKHDKLIKARAKVETDDLKETVEYKARMSKDDAIKLRAKTEELSDKSKEQDEFTSEKVINSINKDIETIVKNDTIIAANKNKAEKGENAFIQRAAEEAIKKAKEENEAAKARIEGYSEYDDTDVKLELAKYLVDGKFNDKSVNIDRFGVTNGLRQEYQQAMQQRAQYEKQLKGLNTGILGLSHDPVKKYLEEKIDITKSREAILREQLGEDADDITKDFKIAQMASKRTIGTDIKDQLKGGLSTFFSRSVVLGTIGKMATKLTDLIKIIVNLDGVMTDIRIVTGENEAGAQSLMKSYSELGKQLGVSTQAVANSANEWLRQGYSIGESNKLIESSIKLSKLGMIESTAATKYLTSTLKGFKLEASEASTIVDKLTTLDLNYATSAGDIAEAISRTASVAKAAGMDLDTTAAALTTIMDITQQDAGSTGTAMRSMLSRYGSINVSNYKSTLSEEDAEGINDIEKVLKTIGITIRTSTTDMKDYDQLLEELADKWINLSDVEKNLHKVPI